jgi:hypothetical protein
VTGSRFVVPGSWYGVLGNDVAVLLPPAAKPRVARLWERVDEGAGFDEVLDALISDGLRELPGFVLVSSQGSDVRIVIRGAGRAELATSGGPVTVSGAPDTTWVEQSVTGVSALRIHVADGDGPAYPFGNGLVRVAGVEQPAAAPTPSAPPVVARSQPESRPGPGSSAPPDPPPVVTPDPGDPPSGAVELEQLTPVPESPTRSAPPPDSVRPVARLVLSTGQMVDVDCSVLIGRAPDSHRLGGDGRSRMVTVPSPHQEISSTHLEIRPGEGPDLGAPVVTDLGSTNGTVVVQPGLPAEDLRPGAAVQLLPGAIVDLGEGVTIRVTTP